VTTSDTGFGIPPEILSRIFEPFFTTKGPDKGTGLGLSQAFGFAQQSGGAIRVRSKIDQGTQATLYLPRSHAPVIAIDTTPAGQSPGRGETILVVEDNPDVKAVAMALLEQLNYRSIAVEDAKAALDFLATGTAVDLVFSDVVLPGKLDGLGLAKSINERYPRLPVLLTSGYSKALASRHGLPILRKPYQISALAEAIRSTLDGGPGSRGAELAPH